MAKKSGSSSKTASRASSRRDHPTAFRRLIGQAFDGHGADALGLALVAAGLVCALGIYGDVAGPLGDVIDTGAGVVIGLAKVCVPPALVVVGVVLIRGPVSDPDEPGPPLSHHLGRLGVGIVLVGTSVTGLLHLGRGRPGLGDGAGALGRAGGALGWLSGTPLHALVAAVGAVLVLATIGVLGLLVLTQASVRAVLGRSVRAAELARTVGRRLARLVVEPPAEEGGPTVTIGGQTPEVFDQDASIDLRDPEPEPAAAPEPRRSSRTFDPEPIVDGEQLEIDLGPGAKGSPWRLPSPKLLLRSTDQEIDQIMVEEAGHTLQRALAAHGVETRLVGMVVGPTVTRYELELGAGVKVARVTSLHKDIAYSMASPDVRILAPIPGRQAIGVEVPNRERQIVALGDILATAEARRATHPLEVAVGRDINGKAVMMNLAKMPHILIAGATGAGKSSCINSIITSILMRSTPEQVRLILVDPKMVEMTQYERVPHLLTQPVVDPKKAANALAWACREMDRRYELLSNVGVRDIDGYNASHDRGELRAELGELDEHGEPKTYRRLPLILVVIDELSDLMMVAARDVEDSICRIAQKARAVGIHLVIATQRPSINVITGVIKANIPARLAFAVSSLTDSRVILDQPGAERLVGEGDLLMVGTSSSVARRVQGAWVTEDEVRKVVAAWRRQEASVDEVPGIDTASIIDGPSSAGDSSEAGQGDDDDLLQQALELVVTSQLGSTSMLQRKLRVGFARAGRLMDLLEQRGVVGPSTGSKAREVLMSPEELGVAAEP